MEPPSDRENKAAFGCVVSLALMGMAGVSWLIWRLWFAR